MKKAHWWWKAVAPLLCVVSTVDMIAKAAKSYESPVGWAGSLGLAVATVGVVQYAFGWPRVPRLVWRIFGPPFSMIIVWQFASAVGWFGTRLVIKHLSLAEQLGTVTL